MSTPTVYKHTDASAPGLPGIMNSYADVFAIFHGCLVAGYGSKAGAGWTLQWQDEPNNKFVLKSGSGFYLRFQKNGFYSSWGAWTIQTFRAMTDIDTGTGAGAINQFVFSQNQYTGCGEWIIIADSDRFYLYVDTAQATISERDNFCWFVGKISPHSTMGSYDGLLNGFCDNGNIKNNYNLGVFTMNNSTRQVNNSYFDQDSSGAQGQFNCYYGPNFSVEKNMMRPVNNDVLQLSTYQMFCESTLVGHLPGLLIPGNLISGVTGDTLSINGQNHILLTDFQATEVLYYNRYGMVVVNTESWV